MSATNQRRLHPAPPDYGIIEFYSSSAPASRFVIYWLGSEIGRSAAPEQAWQFAERHRARHSVSYRWRDEASAADQ